MDFFGFGQPNLRRQGSENRQPPPIYTIPLKAFPALYLAREDLEPGNKILLPTSILHNLSAYRLPQPMIFSLQNAMLGNSTNVGVLEFVADEGTCVLPNWMFETLCLDYGAEVNLQLQSQTKRGTYCKLQPHNTEFIELPDPRAILEKQLSNYVCLTLEDTISIKVLDKFYKLNILEVKPQSQNNCICLIDADVEVDFAAPLDYVEDVPSLIKKQSSVNLDDEEDSDEELVPFSGQGIKINGTKVDGAGEKKKKVSNDEYDPRKHKLTNGVRSNIMGYEYKGKGVTVGGAPLNVTTKPTKPTKEELPQPLALKKQTSSTDSKLPGLQKQISSERGSLSGVGIKPTHGTSTNPSSNLPQTTLSKQPSNTSNVTPTTLNKQNSLTKPTSTNISSQGKDIKEEGGIKTVNSSISKPTMMGSSKPSSGPSSGPSVTKPPTSSNSNSSSGSSKPTTQSTIPSNIKKK